MTFNSGPFSTMTWLFISAAALGMVAVIAVSSCERRFEENPAGSPTQLPISPGLTIRNSNQNSIPPLGANGNRHQPPGTQNFTNHPNGYTTRNEMNSLLL